jgi:hypothetical protein
MNGSRQHLIDAATVEAARMINHIPKELEESFIKI